MSQSGIPTPSNSGGTYNIDITTVPGFNNGQASAISTGKAAPDASVNINDMSMPMNMPMDHNMAGMNHGSMNMGGSGGGMNHTQTPPNKPYPGQSLNVSQKQFKKILTMHKGLAFTAFIGLLPLAIIVARNKEVFDRWDAKRGSKSKRSSWLIVHIVLQSLAIAIGFVGIVVAYVGLDVKQGVKPNQLKFGIAHKTVGTTIFALLMLQMLFSISKPLKNRWKNVKFNEFWKYTHNTVGYVLLVLGVVNVIVGYCYSKTWMGALYAKKFTAALVAILVPYMGFEVYLEIMKNHYRKIDAIKAQHAAEEKEKNLKGESK